MLRIDGPSLERFRRIARNHRLPDISGETLDSVVEIERIRSLVNGSMFAEAQEWMLPHWALKALEKANRTKVVDEGLTNNGFRNWLVIGGVGGKRFAISDSSGLVTADAQCGSLDFWLQEPEGLLFPALQPGDGPRLQLISPEDQVYEWKHTVGPVEFSRMVYYASHNEQEFLYNEIRLRNMALEPSAFTFYLALRPLSIRGVEPIESIVFDSDGNRLLTNSSIAVVLDASPSSVILTTMDDPNIPNAVGESGRLDTDFSTARGLGTAVLRYDVTLPPAGTQEFLFMSPLDSVPRDGSLPSPSKSGRDVTVEEWFTLHDNAGIGEYPDRNLKKVITQARAALSIQAHAYLCPDQETPCCLDMRERTRVLLALVRSGITEQAQRLSRMLTQTEGRARDDSDIYKLSALVWGGLQLFEHTQNQSYLKQITPFLHDSTTLLLKATEDYLEERKSRLVEPEIVIEEPPPQTDEPDSEESPDVSLGETDDSVPEEEEAPPEPVEKPPPVEVKHSWTTNELTQLLWDYAALRSLKQALDFLDEKQNLTQLEDCQSTLEELILEILEQRAMGELDAVEVFNLIADAALLGLTQPYQEQLNTLLAQGTEGLFSKGLYREPQEPNRYSSHLALRLALFHCQTRHRSEAERLLQRSLEFVSEFDFLPEWVNLRTYGGRDESGCSILAAADLLLLVREMVLFNDEDDLILLTGIPDDWFTSTFPMILDDIPTRFGPIHVEIGASANQHQIEVGMEHLPRELEVHVPQRLSLPMVKVYGAAEVERSGKSLSPYLRVVPLSERVILTFHK